MTELADQPDIAALIPHQEVPKIYEQLAGNEQLPAARRLGKTALRVSAAALVLATPVAARIVNSIEDMPPTHIPMTIAGAEVEAQIIPSTDEVKIEAFGHAFVHPSDIHVGRKTFGVTVNFQTDNVNLAQRDGSPDSEKIGAIVRKFSDPTPQKHEIEEALKTDIEKHALRTGLETFGIEAALIGLYAYRRRQLRGYTTEQQGFSRQDRRVLTAVGAAGVVLAAGLPIIQAARFYASPNVHHAVAADPAFKDTPAEGWEVKGPFASFIDVSWHSWNKTVSEKNAYYDAMLANFKQEFLKKYSTEQLPKPTHAKRIMFIDDMQGMDGPTLILGAAAKAYNVDVVAVGGDTEEGGALFSSVLDAMHEHFKGIPVIMGRGVHDTDDTFKMARQRGFTVADNKVHEVGGVAFLAATDASTIPGFGLNKRSVTNGVNEAELTAGLIDTLCAASQPVIGLAHDHAIGVPVAEKNCPTVPVMLTGRYYYPPASTDYGNTVLVTNGSTGGHDFGEGINLTGIIANKATFKFMDVNEKTLEFLSMVEVTLDPIPTTNTSTPGKTVEIGDTITREQIAKYLEPRLNQTAQQAVPLRQLARPSARKAN